MVCIDLLSHSNRYPQTNKVWRIGVEVLPFQQFSSHITRVSDPNNDLNAHFSCNNELSAHFIVLPYCGILSQMLEFIPPLVTLY